jgi:hypothetical protein
MLNGTTESHREEAGCQATEGSEDGGDSSHKANNRAPRPGQRHHLFPELRTERGFLAPGIVTLSSS